MPDLVDALAALPPTDLQSLLIAVHRRAAARCGPRTCSPGSSRDAFARPADGDPRTLAEVERIALDALPDGCEPLALAPVCPLGTVSAITPLDQRRVLATDRRLEVLADPTNVLALEAARRRRPSPREPRRSGSPRWHACSARSGSTTRRSRSTSRWSGSSRRVGRVRRTRSRRTRSSSTRRSSPARRGVCSRRGGVRPHLGTGGRVAGRRARLRTPRRRPSGRGDRARPGTTARPRVLRSSRAAGRAAVAGMRRDRDRGRRSRRLDAAAALRREGAASHQRRRHRAPCCGPRRGSLARSGLPMRARACRRPFA